MSIESFLEEVRAMEFCIIADMRPQWRGLQVSHAALREDLKKNHPKITSYKCLRCGVEVLRG